MSVFSGVDAPGVKVVLLGSDVGVVNDTSMKMTEILEYSQTLVPGLGIANGLPHFQSYKLAHARKLADSGHISTALLHVKSIDEFVKNYARGTGYFHRGFLEGVMDLKDLLGEWGMDEHGGTEKKVGGGWLGSFADSIMNGVVGEDNEVEKSRPEIKKSVSTGGVMGYFTAKSEPVVEKIPSPVVNASVLDPSMMDAGGFYGGVGDQGTGYDPTVGVYDQQNYMQSFGDGSGGYDNQNGSGVYDQQQVYQQPSFDQQSYTQQPVFDQQQNQQSVVAGQELFDQQQPVFDQQQYNQPHAIEQHSYNQQQPVEQPQYNQPPVADQQQYNQPLTVDQHQYNQPPAIEQQQFNQPHVADQQQYNQQQFVVDKQSYSQTAVADQQQYNQPPTVDNQQFDQNQYQQHVVDQQSYGQTPVADQQQYSQPPVVDQQRFDQQPVVSQQSYNQTQNHDQQPVVDQNQYQQHAVDQSYSNQQNDQKLGQAEIYSHQQSTQNTNGNIDDSGSVYLNEDKPYNRMGGGSIDSPYSAGMKSPSSRSKYATAQAQIPPINKYQQGMVDKASLPPIPPAQNYRQGDEAAPVNQYQNPAPSYGGSSVNEKYSNQGVYQTSEYSNGTQSASGYQANASDKQSPSGSYQASRMSLID